MYDGEITFGVGERQPPTRFGTLTLTRGLLGWRPVGRGVGVLGNTIVIVVELTGTHLSKELRLRGQMI